MNITLSALTWIRGEGFNLVVPGIFTSLIDSVKLIFVIVGGGGGEKGVGGWNCCVIIGGDEYVLWSTGIWIVEGYWKVFICCWYCCCCCCGGGKFDWFDWP